ncbi:MAG: TldD/PmbA family protein [Armatimonadetes bacterium]|nr:TldD/PmbA family protein [Armatimonadota bacterium]
MIDVLQERFERIAPPVEFCSLRYVDERSETIRVRQGVLEPVTTSGDAGAMITVMHRGGAGYAATSNLSEDGLRDAVERAREWARRTRGKVVDIHNLTMPASQGTYASPVEIAWESVGLPEKVDMLRRECERLKTDARIVDWEAVFWYTQTEQVLLTSGGGRVHQHFRYFVPYLSATANEGSETQSRSLKGRGGAMQGGFEIARRVGFFEAAPVLAEEALALLQAPDCPSGVMDVLLDPDQMILQIHESIGHPLELDRILGDERNYAGTSFVTMDMFGSYRYGSELLNVTYDPGNPAQYASYGFDDDGLPARREFIIRDGILERPLGGAASQARSSLPGVANARACSWNRPPIDRMANLNLEPGISTLDEMIAATERGVYMKTNNSWSIDDSRNKFQFGCEWGRMIENGRLAHVVKSPNYRGISASFWRNLKMVGRPETVEYLGTPYCGKGEPNQAVRVGHASPSCLFHEVDIFGGV